MLLSILIAIFAIVILLAYDKNQSSISSENLQRLKELMAHWDNIIDRLQQLDTQPNQLITLSSDMRILVEQSENLKFPSQQKEILDHISKSVTHFKWIAYNLTNYNNADAEYLVQFRVELTKALAHYQKVTELVTDQQTSS
jgi:hypothetical protein